MSTTYSIVFKNNSTNRGDVCIFQDDPDIGTPNVMSVAWFSKTTHPTTSCQFRWEVDYSFVWAETGELAAGVMFTAAQNWPADLTKTNQVSFTYLNNAYTFRNQGKGNYEGNLYVWQNQYLPMKKPAVGIGMGGKPTHVVQAQPNIKLTFTPHPRYYIAFGNFTEGEVLDITALTGVEEISFKPNCYSMTAILNYENTWTIMETAEANEKLLQERETNPRALFAGA